MALLGSGGKTQPAPRHWLVPSGGSCLDPKNGLLGSVMAATEVLFTVATLWELSWILSRGRPFSTSSPHCFSAQMAEIWNNCLPPVFTSSLNVTLQSYIYSFWTDVKLWPPIILDFLHRQSCCHNNFCFLDLHIYTSASHAALGRALTLILRSSAERKWYHFLPFVGWNRPTLKLRVLTLCSWHIRLCFNDFIQFAGCNTWGMWECVLVLLFTSIFSERL